MCCDCANFLKERGQHHDQSYIKQQTETRKLIIGVNEADKDHVNGPTTAENGSYMKIFPVQIKLINIMIKVLSTKVKVNHEAVVDL